MTRKFVILATATLLILGVVMWRLGLRAQYELEAVATEEFNRQQLILAQKVAQDIEQHFAFLRSSLLELASIWRKHPALMHPPENALPPFQEILRTSEVLAIGYVAPGSRDVTLYDEGGRIPGPLALDYGPFLEWAGNPGLGQDVRFGPDEAPSAGPFAGKTILRMAVRHWPGEAGRDWPDQPGIIFLVVDARAVAGRYAHDVRSGRTGYAWVLDQRGVFLDHNLEEFIGRDAFSVRKERNSKVSYERIDAIMRDAMLAGKQGQDWYLSGWHRGFHGEVKKLIAYAPARLAGSQNPPVVWSVAVAAPVEEVEGLIARATRREMFMVAAFQVVVFLGLVVTMYFGIRWSASLKSEVEARTAELREARDKIKLNLKELLETQERLIRSERFAAVGEAAAHISHEIRNPLMLIGGFARQVRRALPEGGKEAKQLSLVEDEAKRLESMLEEVRDFTRPSVPRMVLQDLNATVWETVMLMEGELSKQGVVIRANLDKSLPLVAHDPSQIRQVIINLIKNAAEAMANGGLVVVTSRLNGETLEVEVRDNGPGLTQEQAKMIFNPFYTTKERGTGLGLPVCYRILHDHGGDIRVDSPGGAGCVFTLSLPVVRRKGGEGAEDGSDS
jgi:signal transduction histidine kinase